MDIVITLTVKIEQSCESCKFVKFTEDDDIFCKKTKCQVESELGKDCHFFDFDKRIIKDWSYCKGVAK